MSCPIHGVRWMTDGGICDRCEDDRDAKEKAASLARIAQLERELAEARAETAACLDFLGHELDWEYFRADMLYSQDRPARTESEKNAAELKRFLMKKGHGLKFLADRDEWKRKAEELEMSAKIAEAMEKSKPLVADALRLGRSLAMPSGPDFISSEVRTMTPEEREVYRSVIDKQFKTATEVHAYARDVVNSSDAGRGWVSPETYGRLKEWAKKALIDHVQHRIGCTAITGGICVCGRDALLTEAEALGLK